MKRHTVETVSATALLSDADVEKIARALHALNCHEADEALRKDGHTPPEKWADPWHPNGKRQLGILTRQAAFLIAHLEQQERKA